MERNTYLLSTHKNIHHRYSFDMQTGKYYLESGSNHKQLIQKIGKFPSKFKSNGSGIWNVKQRLSYVGANPENQVHRHHYHNLDYKENKSYYTPICRKFSGYTQMPRVTKQGLPIHLRPQTPILGKNKIHLQERQKKSTIELGKMDSLNQQQSIGVSSPAHLIRSSLMSLIDSHVVQRPKKKCYNNRCRNSVTKQAQLNGLLQNLNNSLIQLNQTNNSSMYNGTQSFLQKKLTDSTGF